VAWTKREDAMKKRKKGKKTKKARKTKKLKKTKKAKKTKKSKRIARAKKIKKSKKARKLKKTKKARKVKKPKRTKKIKRAKKVKKPKKLKKVKRVKKPAKPKVVKRVPEREKIEIAEKPEAPAPKVPYTQENAMLCMCSKCPVQAESMCFKEKMEKIQAMLQSGIMPPSEDLPGLYCSSGVAACTDIDVTRMCLCSDCPVWAKYHLADGMPMEDFCRDGKAE
jgi:hypothetical protein